MSVLTERPAEGATVALACESGEPADSGTAVDLADALLEVRAARERLRRVDSVLAVLLAEIGRHLPQRARSPANTPTGRTPLNAHQLENADVDTIRAAG